MTPEEKFNQEIWWILQEIKRDNYLTPKGQKIEFSLRSLPKTRSVRRRDVDYGFPQEEVQRKLLFKLQEWKALEVQPIDNVLRGGDIFNPRIYDLIIKQPKFDELYKKYELANSPKGTEQQVKPILRKIENGKLPYKKDGIFYSLWKYANASRLTGKNLISFMDLAPLEGNPRFAIFDFLNSLQELKIELEDITFHKDIYKKYCKTEHDYITDYITKNPKADFSKAIKKLFKNKATFDDISKILGKFDEFVKMKLQLNGLLEFVEFSPSPSAKNIKPLKKDLETYINCFIEDKLFSPELKNFYRFSRQKEIFLQQIENDVQDYGLNFVFRQGEIIGVRKGRGATIGKDEAYLFIHTLSALEKQGFFEIESILIIDMDVPPEKQTDDYKIKIMASEKLLSEYGNKKEETTLISSKKKIDYNSKAERLAWEKKWDTLQTIKTAYVSSGWANNIIIPIKKLTIKDRTTEEIDSIISGFQKEDYFKKWVREKEIYVIENINHDEFDKLYAQTKNIYKKFAKTHQEKKKNHETADQPSIIAQKTKFDSMTGVLAHKNTLHKFQRGTRGDKTRLLLFRKLWNERRYIKNGMVKRKGKPLMPEFLAVQLNITSDAQTFNRNKKAKDNLFNLIKGINRILRNKGFPAKIERQNAIQLVITEK